MIKIIECNLQGPILMECNECKSKFSFEFTDIQRREENNILLPWGCVNIRRYVVCPVCKATINFKVPLEGVTCDLQFVDEDLPNSEGHEDD